MKEMNFEGSHVLVVDDSLKNLQLAGQILHEYRCGLSFAKSGEDALKQMEKDKPDLVLLDVMMPAMDGYEVCRRMKSDERFNGIPVIFLTARNQPEDLVKGFEAGGVDYIIKPFRREELLVRVRNHLQLSAAKEKIMTMNRSRDRLYSVIAHDIRSPLSGILQTIQTLASGHISPQEEDFPDLLKALEDRTAQTMKLLTNLLEWTRVESSETELSTEVLSVGELVTPALVLYLDDVRKKNIFMEEDLGQDHRVRGDADTLGTVFRNLISNAVKFTPEGGKIRIWSERHGSRIRIHVSDSGVGMPEKTLKAIFDENKVITTPGTREEKGSGLGLVIVKDFVKRNGGSLSAFSSPDEGTWMVVDLPTE
ncbi:MAG: hybrid sensor histidine kinase/response regulator [Bacteroidales bacterium]